VERGAILDAIAVTGWPKYDEYANVDNGSTNAKAKTILYLGRGDLPESGIRVLKRISSLLDETGATLLIKPHPIENARQYSLNLPKHSRIAVLEPRAKLRDCLERSDVVITYESTGGIEAVLLGKRLLCLNLDHDRNVVRDMYVESGVAEEIVDLDQLEEWIRNMNDMKNAKDLRLARSKFISDMVYLVDGKASSRIVDLIHEMIRMAPNSNG
jgi:CDP-glycerol glycerophosphotransferase (TagB/SpsB family)